MRRRRTESPAVRPARTAIRKVLLRCGALSSGQLHTMIRFLRQAALLAVLAHATLVAAAPLAVGDPVVLPHLEDQHGHAFELDPRTRTLLFAADKAASDLVTQAFDGLTAERIAALQLRYVADISAMPALVTSMFALPALRTRPYPVGLVRDAALTAALPREGGRVTVLHVADGRVAAIEHAATPEALRRALGLPN